MRPNRASRLARGTAAATIATFVALMSHVAGGGALPGFLGIVVPWILSLFVCTLLAGSALSLVRLTAAVAVSQAIFHTLFVLGTVTAQPAAPMTHIHGGGTMLSATPGSMPDMSIDSPAMWVWHAVACLVTIIAIHRGERTFARSHTLAAELLAWARRRLTAPVVGPAARPLPLLAVLADPRCLVSAHAQTFVRRRGPPLPFAF